MPTSNIWQAALETGASDIHAVTGTPLFFRINGELVAQHDAPLSGRQVQDLMKQFLTEPQIKRFRELQDLDTSYTKEDGTRFRINCHMVGGEPAFAARLIPANIPTVEHLALPEVVMDLARSRDGLILFTGPTGSGKSTSLAAILQQLLTEEAINVIALEDPVEFEIPAGRGIVQQRELGIDFPLFPEGLKHVLRQDPDVVMVGEMRDLETIALALTLAETGHLVLATLHTPNASQTIDRIVDVFPSHQQAQVRSQLSLSLRAVVAQRLVPKKNGGRIANREILIRTAAVANIIRDNRIQELPSAIQTGGAEGMVTFEKDMKRLLKEGLAEETIV